MHLASRSRWGRVAATAGSHPGARGGGGTDLALRLSAVAAHAITVWTFLVVPLTRSGLAPIVSAGRPGDRLVRADEDSGSRGTAAGSGIPRGGLPDSAVHPDRRAEPDVLARGGAGGNRASDPRPSGWRIEAGSRPPAASPSAVGSPAGQRDRVRGGRRDPRADAGGRVRGRAPPAAGVGVPEGRASLSRRRAGARPRQRRPPPRHRAAALRRRLSGVESGDEGRRPLLSARLLRPGMGGDGQPGRRVRRVGPDPAARPQLRVRPRDPVHRGPDARGLRRPDPEARRVARLRRDPASRRLRGGRLHGLRGGGSRGRALGCAGETTRSSPQPSRGGRTRLGGDRPDTRRVRPPGTLRPHDLRRHSFAPAGVRPGISADRVVQERTRRGRMVEEPDRAGLYRPRPRRRRFRRAASAGAARRLPRPRPAAGARLDRLRDAVRDRAAPRRLSAAGRSGESAPVAPVGARMGPVDGRGERGVGPLARRARVEPGAGQVRLGRGGRHRPSLDPSRSPRDRRAAPRPGRGVRRRGMPP